MSFQSIHSTDHLIVDYCHHDLKQQIFVNTALRALYKGEAMCQSREYTELSLQIQNAASVLMFISVFLELIPSSPKESAALMFALHHGS